MSQTVPWNIPYLPEGVLDPAAGINLAFDVINNALTEVSEAASELSNELADGTTVDKGSDLVAYDALTTVRDRLAETLQFDTDLQNDTDPTKGAALVGFDPENLGYPRGTVGGEVVHYRVTDDGTTEGAYNVKNRSAYSQIAPDVRMSYIAHGGHAGFPNIIGSFPGSNASYSVIGGAYDNIIDCIAGTIAGGAHHRLYGDEPNTTHNTVGGGSYNAVERGEYVTISGGTLNKVKKFRRDGTTPAAPTHSTVGGGRGNIVYGGNVTISGGLNNSADGDSASCGGGQSNRADGSFSVVAGGGNNEARLGSLGGGQKNTIGGGRFNTIDSATNPGGNVIAGGENNNVFGGYNTISGGFNCDCGVLGAEPSYAAIGGGLDNAVQGPSNGVVIAGGRGNTASADYSAVTGGRGNSATAIYSRAHGLDAVGRHQSGDTLADGRFSVAGDAQSSIVMRRVQTTDASTGSMGTIALPNDSTYAFSMLIVARRSDADGESAAYRIEGCIDRNGSAATTALVGSPVVTVIAEDNPAWNVGVIANSSSGGISVQVTGEAAKTIRWVARCTLVEVTG